MYFDMQMHGSYYCDPWASLLLLISNGEDKLLLCFTIILGCVGNQKCYRRESVDLFLMRPAVISTHSMTGRRRYVKECFSLVTHAKVMPFNLWRKKRLVSNNYQHKWMENNLTKFALGLSGISVNYLFLHGIYAVIKLPYSFSIMGFSNCTNE